MSVYRSSICLTKKQMQPQTIIPFWQSQCLLTEPSKSHVKHIQLTPEIPISHTSAPCKDLIFQSHGYFEQPRCTPLFKRLKQCHTKGLLRSSTWSMGTINILHQECRKRRFRMKRKSILPLKHPNSICALHLHNPEKDRECLTRGNFMPLPTS